MSTSYCVFGCLALCFLTFPGGTAGTKCYRTESLGEREGNVYHCEDPDKPTCCEEDEQFTCCEEDSDKTLREQLILWGVVLAVVLLIAIGCCYFWKDCTCCKDDGPRRCCCCCHKPEEDQKDLTSLETSREVSSYKVQWPPRANHFQVGGLDDAGTPPPFKYSSNAARY